MRSLISWFALITMFNFAVVGFSTGFSNRSLFVAAGSALLVILLWWLGVAAHELGHAACARALGSTIYKIGIGPIAFEWRDRTMSARKNQSLPGYAGFVLLAKNDFSNPKWKRSFFWFFLAGPVAEALFALVILASVGSLAWMKTTLTVVASCHLLRAFVCLIPVRGSLASSDGSKMRMLIGNGDSAEVLKQSFRWAEELFSVEPPGNWPADVIAAQEQALFRRDGLLNSDELNLAIQAGYYLYLHYSDRHEWSEANHVLTRAVVLPRTDKATMAEGRFDLVDLMSAIDLSLRGNNGLAAQMALDRIGTRSTIRKNSLAMGATACVNLVRNRHQNAFRLASQAKLMLERAGTDLGADALEASWWNEVIETAQQSLPSPSHHPLSVPKLTAPQPQLLMTVFERDPSVSTFSWDPGVASDVRTAWILRRSISDFDFKV